MQSLTRRQRAIYEFVVQQVVANGIPPTLMEIADAFGLSSAAGVSDHLKAIERKGYIRRHKGTSRGIELRQQQGRRSAERIPVLGAVPASDGLRSRDRARDHLTVDGSVAATGAFAVRVASGRLVAHGILRGDYLVVHESARPRRGDLALAMSSRGGTFLVEAQSARRFAALGTSRTTVDSARLLGRVAAVFRTMQ